MKYVSIDIETTGLDPKTCQIIEFAAVIDDTDKPEVPVEQLPAYSRVIGHKLIQGEAFALNMNARLILALSRGEGIDAQSLAHDFYQFLHKHGYENTPLGKVRYTVAGKNYQGFDARFLAELGNWDMYHQPSHRVIDPATYFLRPDDKDVPNLRTCLLRSGIDKEIAHDAYEDACDVIRCVRFMYADKARLHTV